MQLSEAARSSVCDHDSQVLVIATVKCSGMRRYELVQNCQQVKSLRKGQINSVQTAVKESVCPARDTNSYYVMLIDSCSTELYGAEPFCDVKNVQQR